MGVFPPYVAHKKKSNRQIYLLNRPNPRLEPVEGKKKIL